MPEQQEEEQIYEDLSYEKLLFIHILKINNLSSERHIPEGEVRYRFSVKQLANCANFIADDIYTEKRKQLKKKLEKDTTPKVLRPRASRELAVELRGAPAISAITRRAALLKYTCESEHASEIFEAVINLMTRRGMTLKTTGIEDYD